MNSETTYTLAPAAPKVAIWLAALILIHTALILLDAPPPSTDVFLFKEAGTNLALKGRFVARNLPNQAFGEENVFSYYPPIYPLFFGGWSRVFGVGLRQSLSFDSLVRLARVFLILMLILQQARGITTIPLLLVLGAFSLISTDSDRPDDLAICWGLTGWMVLMSSGKALRKIAAGILFGACAGTSPAAACYFTAIGLALVFFLEEGNRKWFHAGAVAVCAVSTFALINLPLYLSDPLSYLRFSKQVPLSTFPYLAPLREGQPLMGAYYKLRPMFGDWANIAWPHLILLSGWIVAFFVVSLGSKAKSKFTSVIGWLSIAFVPVCFIVWTLQPFYLWFSAVGLIAAIFGRLPSVISVRYRQVALIFVFAATLPILAVMFKTYWAASERPAADSAIESRTRVLSQMTNDSLLAVTPDQYFTFRGTREVANVYYVCNTLLHFDFVYVTRHQSLSILAPEPTPIPCTEVPRCFQPVQDWSNHKLFSFLGWELPYYVRGNGGVLYENRCNR
jgi:hypothetical protein